MSVLIQLVDIHLGYDSPDGTVKIFQALSLNVKPGEYVALVGPSGCGKSTILRLLAGTFMQQAASGWVAGNLRIEKETAEEIVKISLLPQSHTLLPWRSVLRNVLLPIELRGINVTPNHYNFAHTLLRSFAINEFSDYYPRQLSGGIAQRVALARALLPDADLLLLDEPLNAVDVVEKEKIQPRLRSLIKQSAATGIHVTHDLYEAAFVADRVLVMSGKPSNIIGEISIQGDDRDDSFRESTTYLNVVKEIRYLIGQGNIDV